MSLWDIIRPSRQLSEAQHTKKFPTTAVREPKIIIPTSEETLHFSSVSEIILQSSQQQTTQEPVRPGKLRR